MRRAVLDELLRLDASADVRSLLRTALQECRAAAEPMVRRFELNRFEVTVDGATASVLVEDVLDPSDEGMVRVSFDELAAAMDMDDFLEAWAREMRELLAELMSMDFGCPVDGNELRPSAAVIPDGVPEPLRPMYRVFDGLSMMDVYNGYALHAAADVVTAAERKLPIRLGGEPPREIHVFGSDGGGSLFALSTNDGAVYYLPSDGVTGEPVFAESEHVRPRRVAEDVATFLELVLRDVQAFVAGDEHHRYVID